MKEGNAICADACVILFVYLNTLVQGMKDGVPIRIYSDDLIWDADDPKEPGCQRAWVRMSHVVIMHVPPDSRPGLSPHLPGF